MCTRCAAVHGEYLVDTGDPILNATTPQEQVDVEGSGMIYFRVKAAGPDPSTTLVTSLGTALWWIEPEIDTDHRLVLLTLLSPSWYLGRGHVRTRLERLDASGPDAAHGPGERWRVHIDPSSVEGPPARPKDGVDDLPPRRGISRNGEVEVDLEYGDDGRALGFDLKIAPPAGHHARL